jgi:hypothetical protein
MIKKIIFVVLCSVILSSCGEQKNSNDEIIITAIDSTEQVESEDEKYTPPRRVFNYFGDAGRSWPYWEQREKEVPERLDSAFRFYLSKFSDSSELETHKEWSVWHELNFHLAGYKKWNENRLEDYMYFNKDSLRNSILLNEYIRHVISLDEIIAIYNHAGFYKQYFDSVTQIRLARHIPSNSDTSHILIVLDRLPDYEFRRLILIEKTRTGLKEILRNDSALVSRARSGRTYDMLYEIEVYPDAFTIAHAHPGRWGHGSEFTFCKKGKEFELAYGVSYHALSKEMYYEYEELDTKAISFFATGLKLNDFKYGVTPDITYKFEIEPNALGADNLEKFFGILY